MKDLIKRMVITLAVLALPLAIGMLFTYEIIKIDWVSFMEIQPSYRPMEEPLPPPPDSVPVQGAAYLPLQGEPANPVQADEASLARGAALYSINCAICHGPQGKGDGPVAEKLLRKPPDLTGPNVVELSDGNMFTIISNGLAAVQGIKGGMPPLRGNLAVGDRWDVVNYVRSLQQ